MAVWASMIKPVVQSTDSIQCLFIYWHCPVAGWRISSSAYAKSIFYGGCLIAAGHLILAFPFTETFFVGLLFIVAGTGLLKPNVSSMVGEIYPSDDQVRRDSGFSIFFMGINIGGLIGPFIVGYLGQKVDWHYGFAAAGVGMIAGVIQYKLTEKNLGTAGLEPNRLPNPNDEAKRQRSIRKGLLIVVIFVAVLIGLLLSKVISINPTVFAGISGIVILTCAFVYFIYVFLVEKLNADEKKKVIAILLIFLTVMMFYAGYEGQGSSFKSFRRSLYEYVHRQL